MPFINDILKYRSLSIVGLEKNTGKTVCLNYVLRRLAEQHADVAVTSIGVDGEQTDSVFATAKPEIVLYEGMRFITSEKHYLQRQLVSILEHVDNQWTSLGRLVTGRVICGGKVLLSGAASTERLRLQIEDFARQGVGLTIVDGALSRLSLASPTVTDAMILATGAAVSPNIQQLISKTRFVHRLINIPELENTSLRKKMFAIETGLWAADDDNELHDLKVQSVFLLGKNEENIFRYGKTIYVAGAVSDRLLKYMLNQPELENTTLIARDFTKLFVSPENYNAFIKKGGTIRVLQRSRLLAVTLNPTSPQGFVLNSEETCARMAEALQTPVYDVKKICRN